MRESPSPIHPGEVLRTILTDHEITQETFADAINRSRFSVNQIVNGRRNIAPEMALLIAKALSSSVDLWLNLQRQYDMHYATRAIDLGSPVRVLVKPE